MISGPKSSFFLQVVVCMALAAMPLAAQQAISLVGSGSNMAGPLYTEWMT